MSHVNGFINIIKFSNYLKEFPIFFIPPLPPPNGLKTYKTFNVGRLFLNPNNFHVCNFPQSKNPLMKQ